MLLHDKSEHNCRPLTSHSSIHDSHATHQLVSVKDGTSPIFPSPVPVEPVRLEQTGCLPLPVPSYLMRPIGKIETGHDMLFIHHPQLCRVYFSLMENKTKFLIILPCF